MENYPKIEGQKKYYVRYPVQVTEEISKRFSYPIEVGKWIAVDVLESGYQHLIAPNPMSEELCEAACDSHNSYHGWTLEEADKIISKSMGLI